MRHLRFLGPAHRSTHKLTSVCPRPLPSIACWQSSPPTPTATELTSPYGNLRPNGEWHLSWSISISNQPDQISLGNGCSQCRSTPQALIKVERLSKISVKSLALIFRFTFGIPRHRFCSNPIVQPPPCLQGVLALSQDQSHPFSFRAPPAHRCTPKFGLRLGAFWKIYVHI